MDHDSGNVCRRSRAGLNVGLTDRVQERSSFMVRERTGPIVVLAPFARVIVLILFLGISSLAAVAQSSTAKPQPSPSSDNLASKQSAQSKRETRDPIERSDEFKSKLTFGIYFTSGARVYDLNLRHQFGPLTAWIAGFYDPKSTRLMRVGAQYDYKRDWLHLVPTLE